MKKNNKKNKNNNNNKNINYRKIQNIIKKYNYKKIIIIILIIIIMIIFLIILLLQDKVEITKLEEIPEGTWQSEITFPDWKGYIDDTLAMNSMYSYDGAIDQGKLYLTINSEVESFDLFINNNEISTGELKNGIYEIDTSKISLNGTNTIQVTNIYPQDLENAIKVNIPYPTVIDGTLDEVGLLSEPFEVISDIIESDIKNGFTSAQMAVIKDNKLVYQNAWGNLNSYNKDGSRIENGEKVTNDTLYDLASNTKMYATIYAIQYLVDNGKLNLDDKIIDLIGDEFVDNTIEIEFASYEDNYPGFDEIKEWKSRITLKNVLMHQAGFPDSGHYHNEYYDTVNQKLDNEVENILFVEDANKENTLYNGICKTPLMYEPGTKTLYSDIDYMLLGIIVEKVTEKNLNTFLSETFWEPMNLKNITYNPLENGFDINDCAATELNGNTRDGIMDFPNVRTDTIQCEVHDEESYYEMEGESGHAGLFANATDLAKLASVMLTGGYENNKFFSKNTRDLFISPQSTTTTNYGIGWCREADDKRVWYFGTQSPESTVGHQGFTGTLTMIDFENNMVVVILTNAINTPIVNPTSLASANDFSGRYYTTNTLGFIPQILYLSLETEKKDIDKALDSLLEDMVNEKQKYIDKKEKDTGEKLSDDHPLLKAKKALEDIVK